MKSIIISIKPKYVKEILNGNKTLEIRKSYPKCELPCEVYIYCTKENAKYFIDNKIYNAMMNGKVVAKFTLNKTCLLTEEKSGYVAWCGMPCFDLTKEACVSQDDLRGYLKGKDGYAWHIDNLVIFDKPKELKDFGVKRSPQSYCFCEVDE